jgi:hypothetical protein
MTFQAARRLHKGDEVIVKETGESMSVLDTTIIEKQGPGTRGSVIIEGLGAQSGYGEWLHVEVK